MTLPWLLVSVASLLLIVYKFSGGKRSLKATYKKYRLFTIAVYQFFFKVKNEDRLNVLKHVHKYYPGYLRINILGTEIVMLYDPDLLKKMFNSQSACQRPFRNCMKLEFGLLASECEFSESAIVIISQQSSTVIDPINRFLDHYWKSSRKHLNVAFNQSILKGFVPIFDSFAFDVTKEMETHLDGEEFDLLYPLTQLTTRSVAGKLHRRDSANLFC